MINGLDACEPAAREALLAHLAAVIARRTTPVHTAVAFNTVYFGYDVEAGGYVGGPLDFEDFPSVALGDTVEALPVGAMINIRTGGDLLPAEIVYKEGAHADLDPYGETPAWVSGAPAGARGPGLLAPDETSVLRERLVFDTSAFGQDLAPTRERLQRLRRRRRTDDFGHLVVEAQYEWADADLSDAEYYARYLVTRGRDQITSALVPTPLPTLLAPGVGGAELLAAVRGLMSTLRQALAELNAARMWGDYAFTRASLARRLADPGPLGRNDLARLADSTVRHAIPRAGRRTGVLRPRPAYTALGPALRSHQEWQDQLHGTAYPLAVCHANSVVSDCARREQDETTGLLPTGVRLSLDDRWQGGGVWRAEFVESGTDVAPSPDAVDKPAGLGWADSLPHQPGHQAPPPPMPTTPPHPESQSGHHDHPSALPFPDTAVDAPPATSPGALPAIERTPVGGEEAAHPPLWPEDSDLGHHIDLAANDSQIEWAQPLRLFHVLQECLPLPDHVAAELLSPGAPQGCVRVVLHHTGRDLPTDQSCHDAYVTVDRQGTRLNGIEWPLDLFPGIWLTFTWQRGSRVIHARTTLLLQPVTVDGELIEHRYDPRVLTRDGSNGLYAGTEPAGEILPAHQAMTTVQLLTTIRRLGLLDRYGCALLARTDLPAAVRAITGEDGIKATGIEAALAELLSSARLTIAWGSRGVDDTTHHPPQPGEPTVELVCYRPHCVDAPGATPAGETNDVAMASTGRAVREHNVAGFLRRIGHLKKEATPEQRALYREDHRRFRLSGPAELPDGFTYVRPHKRSR
ncbi:hypothetical protein IM697_36820 [Streptomyces ferrugineus]|uniref:Uncharacterized protein n=1 Tax=Streptomyces ferrugineus TaxID=1413221 RepID=A0A7M2SGV4_9ACTN|nr:hypothetical protein [Streptomyces ferrugineus]QOV35566.1 hypothetical protein IM697_36820 [Streptomyces ferrugineus]